MRPRLNALHVAALLSLLAALTGGPLPASAARTASAPAAPAAGFVVNSLLDTPDANLADPDCETSTPNQCTLRAALQQANATAGADAITFSVAGTITLTSASPVITDSVSIVGPGAATLVVDGGFWGSVLHFDSDAPDSFYLEGLTVQHGGASDGGGVLINGTAPVVISATVLTGNSASRGGGLRLTSSVGQVQIVNSAILSNTASIRGGGVASSGPIEVINTRIENNRIAPVVAAADEPVAPQGVEFNTAGGGLYTTAPLTLTDSLVLSNYVTTATCVQAEQATPSGVCAADADPAGPPSAYGAGVMVINTRALVRGSTLAGNYFTCLACAAEVAPAGTLPAFGGGLENYYGQVQINDSLVDDNSAYVGGGLYNFGGTLTLLRVRVSGNSAVLLGGGLLSEGGPVGIDESVFVDNFAYTASGGGLYMDSGELTVRHSEFDHNGAQQSGGGLLVVNAQALLDEVAVHNNLAGNLPLAQGAALEPQGDPSEGGGLNVEASLVLVRQSAIYSNTASNGGGIANSGTLTLTNVTLSGNAAANDGGGLYLNVPPAANSVAGGPVTIQALLRHVTLAGNLADSDSVGGGNGGGLFVGVNFTATFSSSLVALNVDTGTQAPACAGPGTYVSAGYNLWTVTTNCGLAATTGDQYGVAAGLLPLQANGGRTLTHGLAFGSLAINTADPANCPPQDQRGVGRPFGPNCDIGAFELAGIYLPIVIR